MFDILSSPLRGYIAQNLQFYLSKYIEGIQLEGLGLFGGDLVLNDLEIKRHVLVESLEIPSSFDFSRGFIRELRIHIPWTQLLSQPIEVKLYTIELILTARDPNAASRRSSRARSVESPASRDPQATQPPEIEKPKSGWLRDTLQKILANVTIQVNNLVLKYEQGDMVLSAALGTLDCYSVIEKRSWGRGFAEPQGISQVISRAVDAKDLTIFLDRYTSDRKSSEPSTREIHRRVVGYEVPVLSRTSVSFRARIQLKPIAEEAADLSSQKMRSTTSQVPQPSVGCDPFFIYSNDRSAVKPMVEIDAYVGELSFSLSDRQLSMLSELLSRRPRLDSYHFIEDDMKEDHIDEPRNENVEQPDKKVNSVHSGESSNRTADRNAPKQSWLGWAMKTLGGPEDDDDDLVSELLAESKDVFRRQQSSALQEETANEAVIYKPPSSFISCFRACIGSTSFILRKHDDTRDQYAESNDSSVIQEEEEEELVPVANLGFVKVPVRKVKSRISRAAAPVCSLSVTFTALECITVRGEKNETELVLEVERVDLLPLATIGKKVSPILSWGTIDDKNVGRVSDTVSHPYFATSFFGDTARKHTKKESRSFELVKVSLDREIPVWKTLEHENEQFEKNVSDKSCLCCIYYAGDKVPCVPLAVLDAISRRALTCIGINDRALDTKMLTNAIHAAWDNEFWLPFDIFSMETDLSDIVREYHSLRKPDDTAAHNLEQNLLPVLIHLLVRKCLHSCHWKRSDYANFGHPRRASSAVRLHYALRQSAPITPSKGISRINLTSDSKLLDISLGPATFTLFSNQVSEVYNLLSLLSPMPNSPSDDIADAIAAEERDATQPESSHPSFVQSAQLITMHSVGVSIPATIDNQSGPSSSDSWTTNLLVKEMSWAVSHGAGQRTEALKFGTVNIVVGSTEFSSGSAELIEILGCEVRRMSNSSAPPPRNERHLRLDRITIQLNWRNTFRLAKSIDGILTCIGMSQFSKWTQQPPHRRRVHCIEACDWYIMSSETNSDEKSRANQVKLSTLVQLRSGAIYSTDRVSSSKFRNVFAAGVPWHNKSSSENAALVKFELHTKKVLVQVASGEDVGAGQWIEESSSDSRLRIATFKSCLKGIDRLIVDVKDVLHSIYREGSTMQSNDARAEGQPISNPTHMVWEMLVDARIEGGEMKVTDMLTVLIPTASVCTSPVFGKFSEQKYDRGGALSVRWRIGDIKLINTWAQLADEETAVCISGMSGTTTYLQQWRDIVEVNSLDISAQLPKVEIVVTRFLVSQVAHISLAALSARPVSHEPHNVNSPLDDDVSSVVANRLRIWNVRCGVQVNCFTISIFADILQKRANIHQSGDESVAVRVIMMTRDIGFSLRRWNQHPLDQAVLSDSSSSFVDLQAFIGTAAIDQVHTHPVKLGQHRFGSLSFLPERCFVGVLLCLDVGELVAVAEAVNFHVEISLPDVASAIAAWHTVNEVVRLFRQATTTTQLPHLPSSSFPLLASSVSEDLMRDGKTPPLVTVFFRNYGESSDAQRTLALSVENSDFVLCPATILCMAVVFDVPGTHSRERVGDRTAKLNRSRIHLQVVGDQGIKDKQQRSQHERDINLEDLQLSVVLGKFRVFMPDEAWINAPTQIPCLCLVVEDSTMSTAVWNNISLDGLGYPPFSATKLPRRQKSPIQRFGDMADARLHCRFKSIYGVVTLLKIDDTSSSRISAPAVVKPGPLNIQLQDQLGEKIVQQDIDMFLRPLSLSVDIEERYSENSNQQTVVRVSTSVSVTKIRADIEKSTFDKIVELLYGTNTATASLSAVFRSWAPQVNDSTKDGHWVDNSATIESRRNKSSLRMADFEMVCDGVNISAILSNNSIHARIGTLTVTQISQDGTGAFSIQNVVVGYRRERQGSGSFLREEVIFGPNNDPTPWQIDVENFPDKLVSGRWVMPSVDITSERSLFVDVQGFQFHVSAHFMGSLTTFLRVDPRFSFSRTKRTQQRENLQARGLGLDLQQETARERLTLQPRVVIKLLLGQSIASCWVKADESSHQATAIWATIDQVFVSVGMGNLGDVSPLPSVEASHTTHILVRYVGVPQVDFMFTVERLRVKTSMHVLPLFVWHKNEALGTAPRQIESSWTPFSKLMHKSAASTILLQECTIRVTGDRNVVVEQVNNASSTRRAFYSTPLSSTNIQIDASGLILKVSANTIKSVSELMVHISRESKEGGGDVVQREKSDPILRGDSNGSPALIEDTTDDDFSGLQRRQATRRVAVGELVFTENLLIETESGLVTTIDPPVVDVVVDFTPSTAPGDSEYNEHADVLEWIEVVNKPWSPIGEENAAEGLSLNLIEATTRSWMSMKWSYHLPRQVVEVVADAVPIPPSGLPQGWPRWHWSDAEHETVGRPCDIVCQLRAWNHIKRQFVVVCEFLAPWESARDDHGQILLDHPSSPGTFGDLVTQWFDADDEEERSKYARVLEVTSSRRRMTLHESFPSDNWELRWRSPLSGEQHQQVRLHVSTLLATSIHIRSKLISSAFQRMSLQCSIPQMAVAVSYVQGSDTSYDLLTTELTDTTLLVSSYTGQSEHKVVVQSVLKVFFENMVQLVSVSLIPRMDIHGMIQSTAKGTDVSLVLGPPDVYLSQTAILILQSIPDILAWQPDYQSSTSEDSQADSLSRVRIHLVNRCTQDIWYRQVGTTESLVVRAGESDVYSWLTVFTQPYNAMQFSLADRSVAELEENEGQGWCDPCRIQETSVTGRYIVGAGFLWISVELVGLKTIVTLCGAVTFVNYTDIPLTVEMQSHQNPSSSYEVCSRNSGDKYVADDSCDALLMRSGPRDGSMISSILERVRSLRIRVNDGVSGDNTWCDQVSLEQLPEEFEWARAELDEHTAKSGRAKVTRHLLMLRSKGPTKYVWAQLSRAECKTVLPNDFDRIHSRFARRFTWIQIKIYPASSFVNLSDMRLCAIVWTKDSSNRFSIDIGAKDTAFLSDFDPLQVTKIVLREEEKKSSIEFDVENAVSAHRNEQLIGKLWILDVKPTNAMPWLQLVVRRPVVIVNNSTEVLLTRIRTSSKLGSHITSEIAAQSELPVGFSAENDDRLLFAIGHSDAIQSTTKRNGDSMRWSKELELVLHGDFRTSLVINEDKPHGLRGLPYAVTLQRVDGTIVVTIAPLIVVHNDTGYNLRLIATSGDDQFQAENNGKQTTVARGCAWAAPVYLPKPSQMANSAGGIVSWLSSAFSQQNPKGSSAGSDFNDRGHAARCAFRISMENESFAWSDEVQVDLPELFASSKHASHPRSLNQLSVPYGSPSSITTRHRRLIQHADMEHTLITLTICQVDRSIHVLVFIDRQPPVVFINEWNESLAVGMVSKQPIVPVAVGAKHYMEYDWGLQTSHCHEDLQSNLSLSEANSTMVEWMIGSSSRRHVPPPSFDQRATRFQLGLPEFGWSNVLWQVSGIQFARFPDSKLDSCPVFLVASIYRAGTWQISITCLEGSHTTPLQSTVSNRWRNIMKIGDGGAYIDKPPPFFRVAIASDVVRIHCSDEHNIRANEQNLVVYEELFQLSLRGPTVVFLSSPESPERSKTEARLGYLNHVRLYNTLFVGLSALELDHFLEHCNFPVILSTETTEDTTDDVLLTMDIISRHDKLRALMVHGIAKDMPDEEVMSVAARVIHVDTWDRSVIPPYFQSVELTITPTAVQIEDDLFAYVHAFTRPIADAMAGLAAMKDDTSHLVSPVVDAPWLVLSRDKIRSTSRQRFFVDYLRISSLRVTVTARMSIPVLSSLDGTPLKFGERQMHQVFAFPDQLYKDLAADYVADVIVRSPVLLMSLNILGNPAGFFRNVGTGLRDLFEIPLSTASRDGFNPWILTKGILGGVASFVGHTSAAALSSLSGFSYSIFRTVDHMTLTQEQMRRRHYVRPTQLTSAISGGLGSLGSSVVWAATGIVSTPMAVYREKRDQGLRAGVGDVVGGFGMGLVGVFARPMGGVASLVAMTSDGILVGAGYGDAAVSGDRDTIDVFEARPNELLRFKLKVLRDPSAGDLVAAHGIWINPDAQLLLPTVQHRGLRTLTPPEREDERVCGLFSREDTGQPAVIVVVVATRDYIFVIGDYGDHRHQVIVSKQELVSIQSIEEILAEPARLDLGINRRDQVHRYQLRLIPNQRRELSHQLRRWIAETNE